MRAEIVSVGTELLLGQIVDTNAAYLAKALSAVGIGVYRRQTVGDNRERLLAALRQALSNSEIVITIGGLGPTMDDITRDGLAEVFGDPLRMDEGIAQKLRDFFALRNAPLLKSNLRQAMVPVHGRALDNPNGTAPGLLFENKFENQDRIGIALPGPPNEFIPLVDNIVLPYLRAKTGNVGTIRSLTLRIAGMGESLVEDKVKDLMLDANPSVAPYAKVGEVHLRVTARADTEAEADALIVERAQQVRAAIGQRDLRRKRRDDRKSGRRAVAGKRANPGDGGKLHGRHGGTAHNGCGGQFAGVYGRRGRVQQRGENRFGKCACRNYRPRGSRQPRSGAGVGRRRKAAVWNHLRYRYHGRCRPGRRHTPKTRRTGLHRRRLPQWLRHRKMQFHRLAAGCPYPLRPNRPEHAAAAHFVLNHDFT